MRNKNRWIVVCIVFLVASTLLFAAGTKEDAAKASTELNVVYSGTPQIHEKEYLINEYFKGFEQKYGVKVNVDFVTQSDAITKIRTEQSSQNIVSDIVYVDTANMSPYVQGLWMEDVSSIVSRTGSTYTKMFDDSTHKDGKQYFVPNSFDIYILIANIRALPYLPQGLTRSDVEKGLSWEQYAQWAVNIAKGEGKGKTMLPASKTGSQLLYPMGGMSLAYGGSFPEFTSEGFKQALGVLATIAAGKGFYSEQDQYSAVTDPMNKGDVWLAFSHMAPAGTSYNAAPNNFVIGAAPHGDTGVGSTSGAWCYGIQKGAPHSDLAEKFIEYIAQPDVNYSFCYNYGGALSPIQEVGRIMTDEDVVMKAGNAILQNAIVTGVPATLYTDWNAVKLLYTDIFDQILATGKVPSDAFLQQKQAALEALRIK
ncbi:MAG: extracellular solute-binding protein [Sphaerochaeta sp.]|jgi:multiple sugar transport system substrate-binding protein|nr:extracellular solute-binding protein [Sphaerochaeta sp.]